jgi:hypothetical protein
MVTESSLVFVSIAVWVAFWPAATFENVISDGLIWIASCGVELASEVVANPAQPLITVALDVTIANSAATAQPPRVLARCSFSVHFIPGFVFAMSAPPALRSVRQTTA